MKGGCL